jgi:CheY-like chemotaxis protein/HPt (histidine-containing phosphotransfer) domain-containing protein
LGISGISNDMRDLLGRTEPPAVLAIDYFIYQAAKEVGALAAVLRGVDGIVFTAGIGENSPEIRQRICEASQWLGIELDVASNGRQAIDMVQAAPEKYAAVLMDVQMPEIDGLAATRALRKNRYTRPIIAMTANAMKGDLEACLAAGMDDHVTKPIERKALVQTLRRWLPRRTERLQDSDRGQARSRSAPPHRPAAPATSETPILEGLDVAGSLQRLGLEFDSLKRMLIRFADTQGPILDALRTAVASVDHAAVARHAHAIAGASGNLGADDLRRAAKALERAGNEHDANVGQLAAELERRAAVVSRSIDTLRATPTIALVQSE